MTIAKAIAILKKVKIKQAKQEIWDLLAVALNKNKSELIFTYRSTDEILSKKFNGYVKKRASGLPFAYVVGHQPFIGLNFLVTKNTLIPHPATEDLVLMVEKYLSKISKPVNIFDIGTGSGCIAISLALRNSKKIKSITATDISAAALRVARKNLISNSRELEIRKKLNITFKKTDVLKNITLSKNTLVVANLPYVKKGTADKESSFQPKSAVFCAYQNNLPVPYLKFLHQIKKQKNLPQAVFLEMPRACSARFQKYWRSALPHLPLFIIKV